MKNRVTKKNVEELINLVNQYGYWSEQVKEYNSQFTYNAMVNLQNKTKIEINKTIKEY